MKFGTDGIRGPVATVVTPAVAWALGRALAELLGGDATVAVARDSRTSGPALETALHAGLSAGGLRVDRLG
ncbi:MAG TPA: phosphoglucosamine mutase, partial [Myxococcota bacterium]|nr:phosphoglucosamine mutase [Myxococcota bacterium]